jgi:hypothetical protein
VLVYCVDIYQNKKVVSVDTYQLEGSRYNN